MYQPLDLQQQTQPIEILHKEDVINGDGSFNSTFETANGIRAQQSGYLKQNLAPRIAGAQGEEENNDIQVIQGSYSYTAPDGTVISLNYTADENGFQPQGAHLPVPPEIPEAIARALQALPQEAQNQPEPTNA